MTHLFYLYAVLMTIYFLSLLVGHKPYMVLIKKTEKYNRDNKTYKEEIEKHVSKLSREELKKLKDSIDTDTFFLGIIGVFAIILYLLTMIYLFCGLLTSQWFLFLGYLIYTGIFIAISVIMKIKLNSSIRIFIMNLINFLFYVTLLLNQYHLHIDFYKLIFG